MVRTNGGKADIMATYNVCLWHPDEPLTHFSNENFSSHFVPKIMYHDRHQASSSPQYNPGDTADASP